MKTKRFSMKGWIGYGILLLAGGWIALPFFWMISTALKPLRETVLYPPLWLPTQIHWENFAQAWQAAPFGQFYINSIITSTLSSGMQITFALLMAYALVFIRFPARRALFVLIVATIAIPEELKLVPNYQLLSALGWVNTLWALILPPVAEAFPVFVLYQWFRRLPTEQVDAAKVDGAGHWRMLWQIIVPASRPILVILVMYSFVNRWNDYLWPLIITNKSALRTLPIGLAYLRGTMEGGNQWNLLMAGALLAIAPILLLFLLAQRFLQAELERFIHKRV